MVFYYSTRSSTAPVVPAYNKDSSDESGTLDKDSSDESATLDYSLRFRRNKIVIKEDQEDQAEQEIVHFLKK